MSKYFHAGLKDILFAFEEIENEAERWKEIAGMFYSCTVRNDLVRRDMGFDRAVAAYIKEAGMTPPWEE